MRANVVLASVVLFSRLSAGAVTSSTERRVVLDAVVAQPGIHLRGLQRATGFAWGKLSYHLSVLARAERVRFERRSKFVHVFPASASQTTPPKVTFHHRGAAGPIFDAIPEAGGITQRELETSLGLSHQLIRYHLGSLERGGWVVLLEGRPRRYLRAARTGPKASHAPA